MMLRVSALQLFAACLFATPAVFAGWGFGDYIDGRTTRENPVYAVGETMTFTFSLRGFKGLDASKCSFDWVRTGDDGRTERGRASAGRPLVLTTSLDRPGFVRYYVELLGADGKPVLRDVMDDGDNYKVRFDGGAGADIFALRPTTAEPKDFDAFWRKMKDRLAAVPWKGAVKTVRLDSDRADVDLYTVEIPCPGGRPATGFLSVPTVAKGGKRFPADVSFYGYGGSWSAYATGKPAATRLRTDVIQFFSSAHGFELMRERAYYDAMRKGLASNGFEYAFDPKQNADPETAYFHGMALRVLRGLEYLKSRPEWNGRDLVAHGGSMGGLQTVWAAALDPDVTHALAEAPWCCDLAGMERRRPCEPWHVTWSPGLAYYDPVILARRIPKTCLFELPRIGLGDYICPPAGVMAFYNTLACPKRGVCLQNTRHDYKAPEPRQESAFGTDPGAFVSLSFDAGGALASIREKASGRELVGERCPFMDVTLADGRVVPSTAMRRAANGNLVFSFGGVPGEAEIRLVPFDGGWTIETVRFDVKDVKTWTVAHVKPGCRRWYGDMACLVSDERSGVALRAYDPLLRTACDEIPNRDAHSLYDAPDLAFYATPEQVASGLMIRADAPDSFVGRKCGLCAGPRGKLRDMLKAMTFVAGVPRSNAGGAWALDAECNRGSYLFTTLMNANSAHDWIEMLELGGFTTAHPYGWWVNYGLYDFNREILPRGLDDLKDCCRTFREAGYRVDLHHLSHCMEYVQSCFMPEVTVDPEDLVERCTYTLAKPFAPGDTEMFVNEKPWDGHTVIMKSHANGNALLIGRELVQYNAMSFEKPYRFSKITRGRFKAQYYDEQPIKVSAETFPVGTKVKYMQQRYGSFYPKPGSKLMDQVSSHIGEIFNACGANGVYFDGAEGMMTIYGTEKGRETTFRTFRQTETGIICESACLYPYSWWYRSRIGPWDHAEWGVKRFIDEHIRCLDEYATKANLLRVNLGWWGPMMGCEMARQHFSDEMEYNGCKGAAIDAADGFQLPDPFGNVNTNSVHFHSEDQLAIFGWWERARLARAFTDDVKAKIRVPGAEFRLRQDETGLWRVAPQQVTAHAVKDAPYAAWSVAESEARRAELRVEALYGATDCNGPQSKSILAPADADVLEKKTAPGVEVRWWRGGVVEKCRQPPTSTPTLILEATNANAFRDGAWARVGKHYPVPYLAVEKAIGLWVKGDGSGALLNVQLEQAISCYHGYSEHYIRLDFIGWRYFALQLRERDAYDFYNHKWPYSHYRINTATEVYRTEIMGQTVEYVNLYLNDIPAGGKTRVEVSDIRTMPRRETVLRDAVVTLNGEDYAVPFEMKSTDVAELTDGVWTLLNDAGMPVARRPAAKMPRVKKGANALAWRAKTADDSYPRTEVTVLSVGDGVPAFRQDAVKSEHLSVEAERPLAHCPSAGLVARQTVRTRPGETAALELRLLGPVDTPAVSVGGERFVFPVKLADPNDILRCTDGRNWTVTRVDGIRRPVLAKGTLPRPIGHVSGAAEVVLSSADESRARARLSILKRYGKKDEGAR